MYHRPLFIIVSFFLFTIQGLAQVEELYKVVETMPRLPGCNDMDGTDKEKLC